MKFLSFVIFWFLSSHQETFGLVILEDVVKKPVVVRNHGGMVKPKE